MVLPARCSGARAEDLAVMKEAESNFQRAAALGSLTRCSSWRDGADHETETVVVPLARKKNPHPAPVAVRGALGEGTRTKRNAAEDYLRRSARR
jgi:hypothetical protein